MTGQTTPISVWFNQRWPLQTSSAILLFIVETKPLTTVESLERAIATLSPADLAAFRRWFAEFDADTWDIQIEADAASGKFDALAAEALAEYNAGKAREI